MRHGHPEDSLRATGYRQAEQLVCLGQNAMLQRGGAINRPPAAVETHARLPRRLSVRFILLRSGRRMIWCAMLIPISTNICVMRAPNARGLRSMRTSPEGVAVAFDYAFVY